MKYWRIKLPGITIIMPALTAGALMWIAVGIVAAMALDKWAR